MLISGLMKDGLGNWAEAAAHIGTRTKEECERHYKEVYLNYGPNGEDLDAATTDDGEPPKKRRRREFMPVRS